MFRKIVLGLVISCCLAGTSHAQNCGAYPNTLTNGTNADATQVMANFTAILNCVNNLATGTKPPKGHIFGLTLSNNASDAANDIDVAAGETASTETNQVLMSLASPITKRLDAAWAVGSGNGGLDTGSVGANATYHVWLIQRSDTNVVDVLFSLNPTTPTMPANYDRKRRIGSILRESSAIIAFTQIGDKFMKNGAPTVDLDDTNPGNAQRIVTVKVPTGIVAEWIGSITIDPGSVSVQQVYIRSAFQTDISASGASAEIVGTPSAQIAAQITGILTNPSAAFLYRVGHGLGGAQFRFKTAGWIDSRGRFD